MKKTVITVISIILVCILMAACANKEAITEQDTVNTTVEEVAEPFDMEETELKELYLKLYQEKSEDEEFISDIEMKVYKDLNLYIRNKEDGYVSSYNEWYNETREYYYPIVVPDTSEVVIVYTDEYGNMCLYNSSTDEHDYYRNVHVPESLEFIDSCTNYSVVFENDTVQLWEFGAKTAEVDIPADAKYVGYSDWEQYLFRYNGDVYSVQINAKEDGTPEFVSEPIAHDVKEVLVTDYKLNSDAWSQPLFLMNDGTVKAYCVWNGEEDSPRDHVSHLVQPTYEGGWK